MSLVGIEDTKWAKDRAAALERRCEAAGVKPFPMKFIDGTPVPDSYRRWIAAVVDLACEAEDRVGIEELDGGARQ